MTWRARRRRGTRADGLVGGGEALEGEGFGGAAVVGGGALRLGLAAVAEGGDRRAAVAGEGVVAGGVEVQLLAVHLHRHLGVAREGAADAERDLVAALGAVGDGEEGVRVPVRAGEGVADLAAVLAVGGRGPFPEGAEALGAGRGGAGGGRLGGGRGARARFRRGPGGPGRARAQG